MRSQVLVSWLGHADLKAAAAGQSGLELGPIGQAVKARAFGQVQLLSDAPKVKNDQYAQWLATLTSAEIVITPVVLQSPMDFGRVYQLAEQVVRGVLHAATVASEGEWAAAARAGLVFHLSPGTSAMTAGWIILAKTKFPAEFITSSVEHGVVSTTVPFEISADYLGELLRSPDQRLRGQSAALPPDAPEFAEILGTSPEIRFVKQRAQKVAARSVPVLLEGESGTGKELFARAIHKASTRRAKPFVAVNCGAIPKELVESELFGHKKGAFSGASDGRLGHFREAHGGTLFLDEIGELPLETQVKLLRVLESHEVTPVGESRSHAVDVRIIAATHRNLLEQVQQGKFRDDLFFRLAVARLRLPPLRQRMGDFRLLVDALLRQINSDSREEPGFEPKKLSPGARNVLAAHRWPGNVRELKNTLLRAAIWSDAAMISAAEMQEALLNVEGLGVDPILGRPLGPGFSLDDLLNEVRRPYIERALEEAHGSKTRAARLIGFKSHQRLDDWIGKLGVKA